MQSFTAIRTVFFGFRLCEFCSKYLPDRLCSVREVKFQHGIFIIKCLVYGIAAILQFFDCRCATSYLQNHFTESTSIDKRIREASLVILLVLLITLLQNRHLCEGINRSKIPSDEYIVVAGTVILSDAKPACQYLLDAGIGMQYQKDYNILMD